MKARSRRNWAAAFAVCLLLAALVSCGYHVAGKADVLPKTIKTVAIPAFGNVTTRYKLSDVLPAALTREFISRTRYQVVPDPNNADAVLSGTVVNFYAYPTIFDPKTSRAAAVQAIVILQVTLRERATSKVLFTRPSLE